MLWRMRSHARCMPLLYMIMFLSTPAAAQQFAGEEAWRELFVHQGVRFLYVFYPKADAVNDGVVMMLQNQNDYWIHYRFTIVFESLEGTTSAEVEGKMESLEMKTGDAEGLFWIPFEDMRSIGAIRIKDYKVTRIDAEPPVSNHQSSCL